MRTLIQKSAYLLPFAPVVAFGAAADLGYFTGLITTIGNIISALIPIAVALGILFFVWGLVQFIMASGDESAKDEGKRKMIWGVVALFVIVSVWGLVALLGQLTGVNQTTGFTAVKFTGN
jgi:Type IV secretion system pilin